MTTPESKAREIVNRWDFDFSGHAIDWITKKEMLIERIIEALTLPEVTSDEIENSAQDYWQFGPDPLDTLRTRDITHCAFKAGAKWAIRKFKGE